MKGPMLGILLRYWCHVNEIETERKDEVIGENEDCFEIC